MKHFLHTVAGVLTLAGMVGCQSGGTAAQDDGGRTVPVAFSGRARSADGALEVGDAAPPLSVNAWIRGKPVDSFSKFRVYAVVFWSPTSGPSVETLPHLNRLQRDNEDVIVVGAVATDLAPDWEADTRRADLERFVVAHSEEMDFRIAFDGKRVMRETWMRAAGQRGIPCAFVIGRDGKIAWIGHPDDLDEPVAQALQAGRGWAWSQD